jgi:hypothetical protein
MRSVPAYITLLVVAALFYDCGKTPVTTRPTPPGNKGWFVKDISFPGPCGGNNFTHRIFTYDNAGKITRVTDSSCAANDHFDILYDSQGKIIRIIQFQSSTQVGTQSVIYNAQGNFVAQLVADNTQAAVTRYSWNLEGNQELDEWVEQGNPLIIGLPNDIFHDYSYTSGGIHGEDGHTGGSTPTPVQTLWTLVSAGTGTSVPNPFHINKTPEQIFLYYNFCESLGDWNLLGNSLPNGIFEAYSYTSGTKKAISHFYSDFSFDSNNNVSGITTFGAQDAPNFGTFVKGITSNITYEQH